MSNLTAHAIHELNALGETEPMRHQVLDLVARFAKHGHSGSSAAHAIGLLTRLLAFEPLAPLTGDDAEWVEVGEGLWQNNRCSHVFKTAEGAYDIDGRVFRDPDGSTWTNINSRTPVTFPYTPTIEYVDRPKVVDATLDASEANRLYGEAYGVDWRYADTLRADRNPWHTHDLVKTGDADSHDAIEDSNGEVVLSYCRRCNGGEIELYTSCEQRLAAALVETRKQLTDMTKARDTAMDFAKFEAVRSHEQHKQLQALAKVTDANIAKAAKAIAATQGVSIDTLEGSALDMVMGFARAAVTAAFDDA